MKYYAYWCKINPEEFGGKYPICVDGRVLAEGVDDNIMMLIFNGRLRLIRSVTNSLINGDIELEKEEFKKKVKLAFIKEKLNK